MIISLCELAVTFWMVSPLLSAARLPGRTRRGLACSVSRHRVRRALTGYGPGAEGTCRPRAFRRGMASTTGYQVAAGGRRSCRRATARHDCHWRWTASDSAACCWAESYWRLDGWTCGTFTDATSGGFWNGRCACGNMRPVPRGCCSGSNGRNSQPALGKDAIYAPR